VLISLWIYIYIYISQAHYFADSSSANNVTRASELYDEYTRMREQYCGAPYKDEFVFDVELLSKVIDKLKRGLDSLSAEPEHVLRGK